MSFPRLFIFALAMLGAAAPLAAEPVELPSYDTVEGLSRYASEADYARAATDARYLFERIAYESDGLTVYAYVYRPAESDEPRPVILFNRGSWTWPSFAAELLVMANRLAEAGYVVVAPMYRGSGGAEGRDEMGGAELADLFALLPVIETMAWADSERLYLYGESRGGMMVYQALRDDFPARAAAVVGAFSDLEAMVADPQWQGAVDTIWPDFTERRETIVERRSAIRWAERLGAPLLILHGGDDEAVSPLHALRLAEALAALGKRYELRIVADGDHVLSGQATERDSWVTDWFSRH